MFSFQESHLSFSLWLHVQKNVPNHYPEHFPFTSRLKDVGRSESEILDLKKTP